MQRLAAAQPIRPGTHLYSCVERSKYAGKFLAQGKYAIAQTIGLPRTTDLRVPDVLLAPTTPTIPTEPLCQQQLLSTASVSIESITNVTFMTFVSTVLRVLGTKLKDPAYVITLHLRSRDMPTAAKLCKHILCPRIDTILTKSPLFYLSLITRLRVIL